MPKAVRGPILNPRADGSVEFIADGILVSTSGGATVDYVGPYEAARHANINARATKELIIPPLLDCHIHIPQHPIRGRFVEGVADDAPHGRLLAGLERNVFPAEARCDDAAFAEAVVSQFYLDTLAQGVVGGAAYMTVSPPATRVALEMLPASWSVGLVLMNQNCPTYLRTNEETLDRDVAELAGEFGRRLIVTDRFAVAVDTPLRKRAVALARKHDLRMQTHLNEQAGEKAFVEKSLYPGRGTYTDVYRTDGLLDRAAIMAHCVWMSEAEFDTLAATGSFVAHCPTSNALLGSGTMALDRVKQRDLPYAICTDVGASPTTSLLAEMATFLRAHEGRSAAATPSEALYRVTLGTDAVLRNPKRAAGFVAGGPMSFVEVTPQAEVPFGASADELIAACLLGHGPTPPTVREAYASLALAGLATGPLLSAIDADVANVKAKLEGRVSRVMLVGDLAFER